MPISLLLAAATNVLAPSGPWTIEYQDNLCLMSRRYGEGSNATVVSFQPVFSSAPMSVIVISPATSTTQYVGRGSVRAGTGKKIEGDYFSVFVPQGNRRATRLTMPRVLLDGLAPDATMTIVAKPTDTTIQLQALDKAMAAYKACETDLLKQWGVDPAALDLAHPPQGSPQRSFRSNDFPKGAAAAGFSGRVTAVLQIDATGRSTDCRVVASAGKQFDEATCSRGVTTRFEPGRDAAGKPTASVYIFSVYWVYPG